MFVFFTSETNEPPLYHSAFAILTFFGSVTTIFVVAGEVVGALQTLGVVLHASHSLLGYTVLAYGNSIGDLFTNITLAKTGYTRMAFAACFGGPMFSESDKEVGGLKGDFSFFSADVLFGIGIRFLLMAAQSPNNVALVREGAAGPNLTWFLLWYFANLLVLVALTNFQVRRSVGIFMWIMYLTFFVMTVSSELGIVHAFGTDHIEEREIWKKIKV
jgi:solute carrier family 24 (sodium/potassium/calcium exchanger), member 6